MENILYTNLDDTSLIAADEIWFIAQPITSCRHTSPSRIEGERFQLNWTVRHSHDRQALTHCDDTARVLPANGRTVEQLIWHATILTTNDKLEPVVFSTERSICEASCSSFSRHHRSNVGQLPARSIDLKKHSWHMTVL